MCSTFVLIGVNDAFFDLGGDSLSASRVIAQVIKDFQVEIPLQLLFQTPTIAEMAAAVAKRQCELLDDDSAIHDAASSFMHDLPNVFLPLSYSQQRLWFLDQIDPGSFHLQSLFSVPARGRARCLRVEGALTRF